MHMCIGVGALLTNGSLAWLKTPVSKGKKTYTIHERNPYTSGVQSLF